MKNIQAKEVTPAEIIEDQPQEKPGINFKHLRKTLAVNKIYESQGIEDTPLNTGEVARLLNIHTNTVRRWSQNGIIKSFRIGPRGDRRFMPKDIIHFLKRENIET